MIHHDVHLDGLISIHTL